jgi:hypothetical protein
VVKSLTASRAARTAGYALVRGSEEAAMRRLRGVGAGVTRKYADLGVASSAMAQAMSSAMLIARVG